MAWQRKIPFGYAIRNGKEEIHPTEAQAVRDIFRAYLSGHSYSQIAREMERQGVKYHQHTDQWNKHMVKRILENEIEHKLRELRKLRRRILEASGEDKQIQSTEAILDYLEGCPSWREDVDEEIFEYLIERVSIRSAEQLAIRLLNGLELTETMERTVR